MANKETTLIILDANRRMFEEYSGSGEEGKTNIDLAFESILMTMEQKIIYAPKSHEFGMITFKNNDISEEIGFDRVTFDMIRSLRDIKNRLTQPDDQSGDIFLAIALGLSFLKKTYGKKKFAFKVFLLTSLECTTTYDEGDIESLINHINEANVKINIVCYDLNASRSDQSLINRTFLEKIEDNCPARIFSADVALELHRQLKTRTFGVVTKYRGAWEISPELKIGILAYTRSREETLKSLKKYSKLAEFDSDESKNQVKREKVTFRSDDVQMTPVDHQDQIKGYYYGNKIVPIPEEVLDEMKVEDERCLKLLGFTEAKNVPRHHYMSGVDIIIPSPDDKNILAFNSIVQGMIETGKFGIARHVVRKNSAPKLVVLHPKYSDSKGFCLYLAQLPTAEDIREYNFGSLEKSSDEQQKLIEELILSMDLMNFSKSPNEEPYEAVNPEDIYNPITQYLDQNIMERALNGRTDIVDLDPRIEEYLYPERVTAQNAEAILERIKEAFGLQERPVRDITRERLFWSTFYGQQVQAQAEDQAQVVQKEKPHEEDDNVVREISKIHPISDFNDMMTNRKEDLVEKALQQLGDLIKLLVTDGTNSSHFLKAFECLESLRKGCIVEDEVSFFNKYLLELKKLFSGSNKKEFWDLLVKKGITLISNIENKNSDVTEEETMDFLREIDHENKLGHTIKEDIIEDELLDDIE